MLKYYHANESYWAILSCGAVYCVAQGGSNFWVLWAKSISVTIQMKAAELFFSCGVVYYALQGGFYITSLHIGGH